MHERDSRRSSSNKLSLASKLLGPFTSPLQPINAQLFFFSAKRTQLAACTPPPPSQIASSRFIPPPSTARHIRIGMFLRALLQFSRTNQQTPWRGGGQKTKEGTTQTRTKEVEPPTTRIPPPAPHVQAGVERERKKETGDRRKKTPSSVALQRAILL